MPSSTASSSPLSSPSSSRSWIRQAYLGAVERAALGGWFIATIRLVKRKVASKQQRKKVFAALRAFAAALDNTLSNDGRKFGDLVAFNVSFDSAVYGLGFQPAEIGALTTIQDLPPPLHALDAEVRELVEHAWMDFEWQMGYIVDDSIDNVGGRKCDDKDEKSDDIVDEEKPAGPVRMSSWANVACEDAKKCDVEERTSNAIFDRHEKPTDNGLKKFSWANLKR